MFDDAGNESVMRLATDAEGHTAQGTGPSSEEAAAYAGKLLKEPGTTQSAKGFYPTKIR